MATTTAAKAQGATRKPATGKPARPDGTAGASAGKPGAKQSAKPAAKPAADPAAGRFSAPRVSLDRIYTRGGDQGETSLVGGQRVPKDDPRIEAYGTVDELNAVVGLCRSALVAHVNAASRGPPTAAGPRGVAALASMTAFADDLLRVQHQLFNLGSTLSTLPGELGEKQPRVGQAEVDWLERCIDGCNKELATLRSFVLPGPEPINALLHVARTVCRRAERLTVGLQRAGGCGADEVRYLNRLSDALFVWSRWIVKRLGADETVWEPGKA